jgi:hypothetical protein
LKQKIKRLPLKRQQDGAKGKHNVSRCPSAALVAPAVAPDRQGRPITNPASDVTKRFERPGGGRQATDVAIAANVLKRMLELGRSNYIRII